MTRRQELDNGLVVVARPNRAARSIAARLVFEAGAAFDPPGKAGTSSLVARLLDRGGGGLSAEAIAEGFERLGVSYVARAQGDTLDVEVRLLAEHLPEVLRRLRPVVAEPAFPEEEVRREVGQTLSALAEREQDTGAVAEDALAAALFPPGHPYREPAVGTRASVPRIGAADLAAFHRERVGPSGSILALAGDIDPDRAIALAADHFGDWTTGRGATGRATIPDPPMPEREVTLVRRVEGKTQADLVLGMLPGLRRNSPDLPAALVLNNAVGEFSMGGRLGAAIRDREGLAYYVYSTFEAGLGAGPLAVRAGVAPDAVRRALDLIRRTLEAVRRRGLKPSEIRDSKQSLAASVPRRLETNPGAARTLADCEFYGLGLDYPERLPSLIRAVERDQVAAAAHRYLTLGRHALVVAGPALKEALR